MWEKEGCEGIWNANWVGDITEEGSVTMGRPDMITPTEDMLRSWNLGGGIEEEVEMASRLRARHAWAGS
jgi:hypothetical protein